MIHKEKETAEAKAFNSASMVLCATVFWILDFQTMAEPSIITIPDVDLLESRLPPQSESVNVRSRKSPVLI